MHLDEEQIQRLRHGEPASAETTARDHLARCETCRRSAAEAEREEREVQAWLGVLDHPAPAVDARTLEAKAIAEMARSRDVGPAGALRWAAGILIALGIAGAAYAVPGSPVPGWVEHAVEWIGSHTGIGTEARSGSESQPGFGAARSGAQMAGIAVAPGQDLTIEFTNTQPEGFVRVSWTDGAEVVVRGPLGAATFTSSADRITIDNPDSRANFEIEVPRNAPRVDIRVQGRRLVLKEGPRITPQGADATESYRLPLTASGS